MRRSVWLAAILLVVAVPQAPSRAAFFGDDGSIAYSKVVTRLSGIRDFDVFMVEPDGSRLRNVTDRAFRQSGPAWSPDGRYLAFHSRAAIHVMRPDGSGLRVVVREKEIAPGIWLRPQAASWSPTGAKLAYSAYICPRSGTCESRSGIGVVDLATGRSRLIVEPSTFNFDVSWSPDGRRLVYTEVVNEHDGDIVTIRPDGSDAKVVTPAVYYDHNATWTPDGRLLFSSWRRCDDVEQTMCEELFVMNRDGTGLQQLSRGLRDWDRNGYIDRFVRAVMSPDGKRLLVGIWGRIIDNGDDDVQLWVWAPETDERVQLTPQVAGNRFDWQPGCTVTGTPHEDVLRGTEGRDLICGLGGADTIYGSGGDDLVFGHGGNDRLFGGAGRDIIVGATGNDRCEHDDSDFSRVC